MIVKTVSTSIGLATLVCHYLTNDIEFTKAVISMLGPTDTQQHYETI